MAKRARGSITRPGQRARLQRSAPRSSAGSPTIAPRPATLTPQEMARAAELEAQILAEARAAEASLRRSRKARSETDVAVSSAPGSIAVRARDEYQYVARDVRRMATIGGSLVVILLGLWVAMHAAGITRL